MEFLSSVDIQDIKQLLFTDSLVSFSDEDHAVGELSITTDIVSRIGQPCILVNANSHGIVGSVPCGTSVTAHLKPNLETLEQIYHEYVELENHSFDKKTVITRRNAKYIVKCTTIKGSDIQKKEHIMSEEDMQGFISEGANILLQRLLVRKGLQEPTSFKSLDSECKLCIVMYIPLSKEERIFAGKEVQVVGIERRILSQDGSTSIWQAFFTTEGCLVQLNQEGSPVKMKLIHRTCAEKKLKTKCNWKEDLQFCSLYLDKKDELILNHLYYVRQHPELHSMLKDFLQNLFIKKPENVLDFAQKYFSSFKILEESQVKSSPFTSDNKGILV